MAGNPKATVALNAILMSREALYARAAATVGASDKSVAGCVAELAEAMMRLGVF